MPFTSLTLAAAREAVDVGMPRGPVTFLGSPVWFELTGIDRSGRSVPDFAKILANEFPP